MELIAFWSELWEWVSIGLGSFILILFILLPLRGESFRNKLLIIGGLVILGVVLYFMKKNFILTIIVVGIMFLYFIIGGIFLIIDHRKEKKQRQENTEEYLEKEIEHQCKRYEDEHHKYIKMSDKLEVAEEELEKSKKFSAERMEEIREMRKVIELKDREIKRLREQ